MSAREKICVALDFADAAAARRCARSLAGRVGWLKVGLELFVSQGPLLVAEVARSAKVFLDLKLHDIPNTAAQAAAAAARTGASLINVHAAGGREMMARAREAVGDRAKVIAVTVLTSLDAGTLFEIGMAGPPETAASRLARLAQQAGLDGVVCSATDLPAVRAACGNGFLTVVPGIRPAGADLADQKRVATPRAAVDAGASILVIGRPITQAPDPVAALEGIVAELGG